MKRKILSLIIAALILLSGASGGFGADGAGNARHRNKISGRLLALQTSARPALPAGVKQRESRVKDVPDGYASVLLYPENKNSDNLDISFFTSRGIKYVKSKNAVSAIMPVTLISSLSEMRGLDRADIAEPAKTLEAVTEGRDLIKATTLLYGGMGGQRVKIAVVDVQFKGFDVLQGKGELPKNLTTKDFTAGPYANPDDAPAIDPIRENSDISGGVHGSACAEIIYDIAPAAQIYLLKVDYEPSFQNALQYCAKNGIKVASGSIGWSAGDSFIDGTGPLAQYVETASRNGVLCVFAAGNEAQESWLGTFTDDGFGFMKFPDGNSYIDIDAPYGFDLEWDDYTSASSRYTAYVYDRNGSFLGSTSYAYGDPPVVSFQKASYNNYKFRVKIAKDPDSPALAFRLCFTYGSLAGTAKASSQSSISAPADARSALSVGAVGILNWSDGPIEYYSSCGPVRAATDPANPYYAEASSAAVKPEIVGPTGVTTLSYGKQSFFGTSAATPHIAAAAAMILSVPEFSSLSPAQLKSKVLSYAQKIDLKNYPEYPNNTYGYGQLILSSTLGPSADFNDIVCFPNPISISKSAKKLVKITNLPFYAVVSDINIFTVSGELVKSFGAGDVQNDNDRGTVFWDLKNQSGAQVAPGVYFAVINTPLSGKKVKKIAVQK
ncbi:MAG: S8 family serine peptidase [Endomicrobia bacterium]|nr:S8 family serine peptidase [Endomicrobiia bacterium]